MEKTEHSKLGAGLHRCWQSLTPILATMLSGCLTVSCAVLPHKAIPSGETWAPGAEIAIIPQPDSITVNKGYFSFGRDTKIIAAGGSALNAANAFNSLLKERHGLTLEITPDQHWQNAITFSTDQSQSTPEEGYSLKVAPGSIQITGSERGMFYGSQSLMQLLPADFRGNARVPAAEIRDSPRFRYRGMHLDVSRHFMPPEFVKKFIRLISAYKYNFFHWHLTDDQGWRIEIKKYPLLTAIGSKRRETVVGKNYPPNPKQRDRYHPYLGDNTPIEGFYTQDEIRDIVAYARARYVTIVPEIDLPAHSSSALAAYHELGCKKNYPYKVQTTWGTFTDIYCPTETTFHFIDDVLTEVIDLFPDSPYIHIGGDEVFTDSWGTSKAVQDLKRANGLSSDGELVSWFIKRVERFVNSKGKKIIGWDEMLDVGVPANATVMSWRSLENGARAARENHEVIMAPFNFTYFDHAQADTAREPVSTYRASINLSKVYMFDPMPAGLSREYAGHVLGGEGCLWTEFMARPSDVEYMMFPRAIALAEALWSKPENKSFAGFSKRLYKELANLEREQVNFRAPEAYRSGDGKYSAEVFAPEFSEPAKVVSGPPPVPLHRVLQAASLGGSELPYRIFLPPDYERSERRYPVLYLLHGLKGNESDWWDRSKLAEYAVKFHLIVVTPGVGDSWYANSAGDNRARYEDAIVRDLIPHIDASYRTIAKPEGRAIAGISMGGLGAMKFALRYPQLFAFAGSVSGMFDVPITARLGKIPSAKVLSDLQFVFGDEKSAVRRENNVFILLTQAVKDNAVLPYLYVSSGKSDPYPQVFQSNSRFAQALSSKDLRFEYNERPGTHAWDFWDSEIFLMLGRMCVFMKAICS
jgi:hexosaminidase